MHLGGNRVPDPDCEAAGGVLRSPSDTRCRYLFVDQVAIISAEERVQVFTEFDWEFSDQLRYYAEAGYSNNIVERPSGGATFNTGSAAGGGLPSRRLIPSTSLSPTRPIPMTFSI